MADMMSVVTIPLKTEKWQEDVLDKRFESYRDTYNVLAGVMLKRYNKLLHDPEYKNALEVIMQAYKDDSLSEKEKREFKKSEAYKEATKKQRDMLMEAGITKFGFGKEANHRSKYYLGHIPSATVSRSISDPLWAAFEKLLYGNGHRISFKRRGDWRRVASDGKSGLRIVNADGATCLSGEGQGQLYALFGTSKGKVLKMPLNLPKRDDYKKAMLQKTWKVVAVTRKRIKERWHYYIQLTVLGAPEPRFDKETGEIKNPVGEGILGVYIDTRYAVVCNEAGEFTTFDLSEGIRTHEEEIAELQRYMDNSRRAMNPDNFNADGTIKNGIVKDGIRRRLRWVDSNGYRRARMRLAEYNRIDAENRTLQRHILANQIIAMGDYIVVNDYPFQAAAMRKKEDVMTKKGTPASKKKAGRVISQNAPATLVTMLNTKLVGRGRQEVVKVKLKDVDKSEEGYRQYYAKLLMDSAKEI